MNKLLYSIVLVIILALPATTQVRTQNRDYETKPITAFAYPWYRIDSTTTIVHICYRIQPSFFTFLKGKNEHQSFEARGELVLDILNEENITVRHTYKLLTFTQPSLQKIDDIERFYFTSVPLSPGTYRLLVELKDNNSPREYRNREYIFTIAKAIDTVSLMSMVFCSLLKSDSNRPHFSLLLYDGAIPFASSGGLFVNTTNHLDQSVSVEWSIVPKIVPAYEGGTSHHGKLFEHYTHFDITECNHQLCLVQSTSTLPFKQYYIPLPLEKLIPGTYECTVQFIFNSVSIVRTLLFDVVWFNKPRSLSDSRLALEVLRYIAPDSVVDAIGSLSTPSGIRRFKNFWDQFNPDTTKAYNPVMAEFYRRVDDAILRFSTEDSNNGYKSDRGKVFILNGSPSKIDRRFKPGSDPIEIWTYERLRKRYIFIDSQRNGNYSFVQEEEF